MGPSTVKATSLVALIPVGKTAAAIFFMGMAAVLLPLGLVVVVPFLTLPSAVVVARGKLVHGVAAALVASALLYPLLGPGVALPVFLFAGGAGTVAGMVVCRERSLGRGLAKLCGAVLLVFLAWGLVLWLVFGVGASELKESADAAIEATGTLYASVGVSQATVETVSRQLRALADVLPYLAPGLAGSSAILIAACALGLAAWIFPRLKTGNAVRLSLSGFRLHWVAAYAFIAGLALILFSRRASSWHFLPLFSGIDLLLVAQTLFFLQGLAVVRWYVLTRGTRSGGRVALYAAAVLGQLLFQLTGLFGLLDTWLDYRKRWSPRAPGADATT